MTLEEFKKTTYHTRTHVIIPTLNRAKIDKTLFIKNGKFRQELLDVYLERIYNDKYK